MCKKKNWGWLGEAKVSCILHHWGIQLILAYSRSRPAILAAGKAREKIFLFLLFLYCYSFSLLPLSLSFFSSTISSISLSLEDNTKWPTRVDVSLDPSSIKSKEKESIMGVRGRWKKPSFEITVWHHSASLEMPYSDPWDRFFCLPLTPMIDPYIFCISAFQIVYECSQGRSLSSYFCHCWPGLPDDDASKEESGMLQVKTNHQIPCWWLNSVQWIQSPTLSIKWACATRV